MSACVVIMCAGNGTRWNNYLGVPKHLINIGGETLIERVVRLLRNNNVGDIYITVKDNDPRYTAKYKDYYGDWA